MVICNGYIFKGEKGSEAYPLNHLSSYGTHAAKCNMYDRGVVHVLCMSVSWGGSPVPKKRHPFHASGVQEGES